MLAIIESKIYRTLAAHKFNRLGALALLVIGLGPVAYVSLSAQPDTSPVTVIVVPQAPLIRAEPGSLRPPSLTNGAGAAGSVSRPITPAAVTRALQTGLAGAACYEGPVNGQWTTASKDAMRRFVSAANARLPVDVPDPVLLALVDSNPNLKCANTETAAPIPADTPVVRVALETQPVAPPTLPITAPQPPLIRVPDEAPQPTATSSMTPRNTASTEMTDRLDASAEDVIVPPVTTAAVPQQAAPSVGTIGKTARRVSYRSSKPARKKASTIDDVSRSITKSVNSLQRSLGSLLN